MHRCYSVGVIVVTRRMSGPLVRSISGGKGRPSRPGLPVTTRVGCAGEQRWPSTAGAGRFVDASETQAFIGGKSSE
jgi:hypothetical protein